jgi:DNA-binding PadR family transcriptional regulator
MYPVLMRLADLNFLEAAWREPEREGRPPRHVYRLTAKGIAIAKEQLPQSPARRTLKASAAEGIA